VYAAYNEKKEVSEIDGILIQAAEQRFLIKLNKGFHVVWIYHHSLNIPITIFFSMNKVFRYEFAV